MFHHASILMVGLAGLFLLHDWNSQVWERVSVSEVVDTLSAIPSSRFITVVIIPAVFAGMSCFNSGGRVVHAGVISAYSAAVAGSFLFGTGFALFIAAVAAVSGMLGFLAQKGKASNRPSKCMSAALGEK
jgi:hypothetical protein